MITRVRTGMELNKERYSISKSGKWNANESYPFGDVTQGTCLHSIHVVSCIRRPEGTKGIQMDLDSRRIYCFFEAMKPDPGVFGKAGPKGDRRLPGDSRQMILRPSAFGTFSKGIRH